MPFSRRRHPIPHSSTLPQHHTVAVAVSGGSDSLLALALLRRAGYDVVALHAHFLPPDAGQRALATAIAAQCAVLDVPLTVVDLSAAFAERVIAPFARDYADGLTPNPCAVCNREMKFGLLLEAARGLGADRLATGHYARLETTADGPALFRGDDASRDQSYFLTLTPPAALGQALFPMARRRKIDNAAALAGLGLAPPLAKESREICFVPRDDYRTFLERSGIALSGPGPIVLADGRQVGSHQGLWRHTVGQRRGLGVAYSEPLYVLTKDAAANALVVGPKAALLATTGRTEPANFLIPPAGWPEAVLVQTCSRMRPRPAAVRLTTDGGLALRFAAPVARPTPGQVAAVSDVSGRMLAGAVLAATPFRPVV